MSIDVAETAIVYPGTVLGEGCKILDYAVVGKQPTLGPRSTTKREELPPVELGPGTIVSTGAVVFAGSHLGARVIVGDQACVRERCAIGDDVVIGRGTLVEGEGDPLAAARQGLAVVRTLELLQESLDRAPA